MFNFKIMNYRKPQNISTLSVRRDKKKDVTYILET